MGSWKGVGRLNEYGAGRSPGFENRGIAPAVELTCGVGPLPPVVGPALNGPVDVAGDSQSSSLVSGPSGSPRAARSLARASFLARTRSLIGTPPSLSDLPRPVGPEPIFGRSASGRLSNDRNWRFSVSRRRIRSSSEARCSARRRRNARWTSRARDGGSWSFGLRPRGSWRSCV